jgi:hypothetical protein
MSATPSTTLRTHPTTTRQKDHRNCEELPHAFNVRLEAQKVSRISAAPPTVTPAQSLTLAQARPHEY